MTCSLSSFRSYHVFFILKDIMQKKSTLSRILHRTTLQRFSKIVSCNLKCNRMTVSFWLLHVQTFDCIAHHKIKLLQEWEGNRNENWANTTTTCVLPTDAEVAISSHYVWICVSFEHKLRGRVKILIWSSFLLRQFSAGINFFYRT